MARKSARERWAADREELKERQELIAQQRAALLANETAEQRAEREAREQEVADLEKQRDAEFRAKYLAPKRPVGRPPGGGMMRRR